MRGRVDEREVEQVGRVTRGKVKPEWKRKREGKKKCECGKMELQKNSEGSRFLEMRKTGGLGGLCKKKIMLRKRGNRRE